MARGSGIAAAAIGGHGAPAVSGTLRVVADVADLAVRFTPGDVIATVATDASFVPFMRQAAAQVIRNAFHQRGVLLHERVGRVPGGRCIAVCGGHACAISEDDKIYCWGRNDHKQTIPPNLGGPAVTFDFEGFYPPVEPEPTLNAVKAGSAVLTDQNGLKTEVIDNLAREVASQKQDNAGIELF